MPTLTLQLVHEMGQALREFGYAIDDAHVKQYANEIIAGQPATGGPGMMIKDWLAKAGLLDGTIRKEA